MKPSLQKILVLVLASFLGLPSALACSVCYGEPDSPMTRGLSWAIIALAGIVGLVLTAVTMFFVHVNRRANALEPADRPPENMKLRR